MFSFFSFFLFACFYIADTFMKQSEILSFERMKTSPSMKLVTSKYSVGLCRTTNACPKSDSSTPDYDSLLLFGSYTEETAVWLVPVSKTHHES